MIDYEHIVPAFVGPKLSYHGFNYDEENSYPPQGDFRFTRNYWGTTQKILICPRDYTFQDVKAVISRREDFPTEVPRDRLLIREPGFRMWLSNRYIGATLYSQHRTVTLVPDYGIVSPDNRPPPEETLNFWWEFHGEHELRKTLNSIVSIIVSQGLDWFEGEVVDVKRHHQKLELRRLKGKPPETNQ